MFIERIASSADGADKLPLNRNRIYVATGTGFRYKRTNDDNVTDSSPARSIAAESDPRDTDKFRGDDNVNWPRCHFVLHSKDHEY